MSGRNNLMACFFCRGHRGILQLHHPCPFQQPWKVMILSSWAQPWVRGWGRGNLRVTEWRDPINVQKSPPRQKSWTVENHTHIAWMLLLMIYSWCRTNNSQRKTLILVNRCLNWIFLILDVKKLYFFPERGALTNRKISTIYKCFKGHLWSLWNKCVWAIINGYSTVGYCSTCSAWVISNSQRVSIVIRVNGEQSHSKGSILGEGCAVLKVLQVNAQLVVGLGGQGMHPLQTWVWRQRRG